jgi:putative nucleotidyltransferase-like protein
MKGPDRVVRSGAPALHADAPYLGALQQLLPAAAEGMLLAACLRDGDVAAQAWTAFVGQVGDVKAYFETNRTGLKGMLPFIEASLAAKEIDAGRAFHTYARVALVREELRSQIYAEILDSVLVALDAAHIPALLLKGGALSATVYPQPSRRHTHAIDLLVDPEQMAPASAALARIQCTRRPVGSGASRHQDYRHWTGLALGLHSTAFFLPYFEMPREQLLARAASISIAGRRVFIMSPEDSLVHICAHAIYSRSRANLRWACDAFYLLERHPNLDWSIVIETAVRSRVGLPLCVLLRWLREALGAAVPAERLGELHERSGPIDALTAESIYAALLHTTLSRGKALRALAGSWRAQLGFLRFTAVPSPRYMRWRHNVDANWKLPVYYADRPRRIALSLMGRDVSRIEQDGAGDALELRVSTDSPVKKGVA